MNSELLCALSTRRLNLGVLPRGMYRTFMSLELLPLTRVHVHCCPLFPCFPLPQGKFSCHSCVVRSRFPRTYHSWSGGGMTCHVITATCHVVTATCVVVARRCTEERFSNSELPRRSLSRWRRSKTLIGSNPSQCPSSLSSRNVLITYVT